MFQFDLQDKTIKCGSLLVEIFSCYILTLNGACNRNLESRYHSLHLVINVEQDNQSYERYLSFRVGGKEVPR